MLQNGAEQLVLKLEQLFQGKEELISTGRLRVCLTASVIVFLNKCFEDTTQHASSINRIIEYLKQCVHSIHTLKIVRGPTFKFTYVVNISHFQAVQVLEIEKIAIGYVSGLQNLRSRIKVLKCSRCVDKLNDILALCGYDLSTGFAWPHLEVADFSSNTIRCLHSSLRLLTSVRCLNLSHNELTSKEDEDGEAEWTYLPEVTHLNLGYNRMIRVPSFQENCCSRITTLILRNNDLSNLQGVEMLPNLETLDVSTNCMSSFVALSSLVHLHRLISICCYGNPISYDARYRHTVVSCLSPSPRQVPIILDGKKLNVEELYNLGQSLQVDLSSYIPARPYDSRNPMVQNDPESFVSSGEFTTPCTPEEKRKSRKTVVRQPSIHNVGDEQHKRKPRTISTTVVETKEELEKLEKFKKDAGEGYLVVRNREQLKKNARNFPTAVHVHSTDPSTSSDFETGAEDLDVLSPESPPVNKKEMQEVREDEESARIFLVSVKLPQHAEETEPSYEYMFVAVKDHEIVERNIDLKETSRLDLKGLLNVNVIRSDEKVAVLLKFSHVHRERKYREYIMDDEGSCEKFVLLLKDFVRKPDDEDIITYKHFKCLRCSQSFKTEEEISLCSYCGSSVVVEVTEDDSEKNKLSQNKTDVLSTENTGSQDPDLIRNTVRDAPVQPDICISSSDKDTDANVSADKNIPEVNGEYGALVSTIQVKARERSFEECLSNEEYEASCYSSTQPLLHGQHTPSPAMNISLNSFAGRESRRFYSSLRSESPLTSSYSSQSGSETRNSTPIGGKTSQMPFSLDSCTQCDHRLKLYLETKLFKGGEDEEFRCMIKCPMASYGYSQGIPSLLVISNTIVYVCKITGFESTRPKEWLSIKACYLLTDLRYIEYGLQSQSFRLEFAEVAGCHTYLVGDSKRCENFLTMLRSVAKKACGNKHKFAKIGKANPQTLANIRIQVFGVKDESLIFKSKRLYEQAVNFTDPPLLKDNKSWFRTLPQSMSGEEFIDWLISRKEASSYRQAVHIGQMLLNAGAIQCFNKDCGYLENDQFYHFNLSAELHKDEASDLSQDISTESAEVNTTIKQYILGYWKDEEKSSPVSIIITNSHVALAEENHQWPLPRLHDPPKVLSGPQFVLKKKQKIINITDVELFAESPCEMEIEFRDEDTAESIEDDRWFIVLYTENSLAIFLDAIKELWETKFGIDLPVNDLNKI